MYMICSRFLLVAFFGRGFAKLLIIQSTSHGYAGSGGSVGGSYEMLKAQTWGLDNFQTVELLRC